MEELNDYLRLFPSKREAVANSLSYFDLRWFAGQSRVPTFLTIGAAGELMDREAMRPLLNELGHHVELHETEHSGYKDGLAAEEWLAGQNGLESLLPEAWLRGS
jgi:cephalosporin-C deacetylase-like acetyl esterase